MAEIPILNPREFRQQSIVTVDLGNGRAVRAIRLDMTSMLFANLVPLPLLAAAQKIIKARKSGDDPIEQFGHLDENDKAQFKDMLERHAVVSVIEPVVVAVDDGNEDHMPVSLFGVMELMAIWKATAIMPAVAPAEAKRFRPKPVRDAPADARDGEGVRPTAEPVADSDYVGQ